MNPFARLMGGLMMDKMMGPVFEKGLNKLKNVEETAPVAPPVKVEMKTISEIHYMSVRDTASMATIGQKLGMHYHEIGEVMKKQGLKMAGAPFAIYYTMSPSNWDMEAAIQVDKAGKADGHVKPGLIKAGNTAMTHYFGAYDKIHSTYIALDSWITQNNKKITGAPWEMYMTDPMMEKDTAKWETDVYFPIE